MTGFNPVLHTRLSRIADVIPYSYEALRKKGAAGKLPVVRHGNALYLPNSLAQEIIDAVGDADTLQAAIDSSLDFNPQP